MLLRKKEEIKTWLNQYQIKDYDLIKDEKYGYVVNVNNHVNLYSKKLKSINVKFNEVTGYFDCSFNELETLEGCPEIVEGGFYCYNNRLKTLKGSPKKIDGSFYCHYNELESLEGCPEVVNGDFNCNHNQLTSLEGCPQIVKGYFDCSHNNLITLKGVPEIIEEEFNCSHNQLKLENLKYLPQRIKGHLNISNNINLKELQDITKLQELKIKLEKNHLLQNINLEQLNKDIYNSIHKI